MTDTVPTRDPGYDWSANSAQGAATLTPEVRKVAREMLRSYWHYKNHQGPSSVHAPERGGSRLRRLLRKLRETEDEPVHLTLP